MTLRVKTTWKRIRDRLIEFYDHHFPERQVYFRSRGTVRFVALSPRFQFMSISIAFGAMLWVGIASASLIFGNEIIEHKEKQIADLRDIRSDLHSQLVRLQDDLIERAETLQERQAVLDQMLDRSDVMFGSLEDQITPATETAETAAPEGEGPLPVGGPESDLETAPAEALEPTSDAVEAKPDDTAPEGHDPLADELGALEEIQLELLGRFHRQVEQTIAQLENALEVTGLDVADVLGDQQNDTSNQGGPMVPIDELSDSVDALNVLSAKVERLETLEQLFISMPLLVPVDSYYVSSHFGGRKDPFTNKWSAHHGVDLGGGWKAPVRAGAAGTVTSVGWSGPYGRLIEVDHGNGFVTRYGHLREFLVKEGQVVQTGDKIGLMGSSGRSTGTHLHYEIRFDGAPLNPINFFEAAKHVQAI